MKWWDISIHFMQFQFLYLVSLFSKSISKNSSRWFAINRFLRFSHSVAEVRNMKRLLLDNFHRVIKMMKTWNTFLHILFNHPSQTVYLTDYLGYIFLIRRRYTHLAVNDVSLLWFFFIICLHSHNPMHNKTSCEHWATQFQEINICNSYNSYVLNVHFQVTVENGLTVFLLLVVFKKKLKIMKLNFASLSRTSL